MNWNVAWYMCIFLYICTCIHTYTRIYTYTRRHRPRRHGLHFGTEAPRGSHGSCRALAGLVGAAAESAGRVASRRKAAASRGIFQGLAVSARDPDGGAATVPPRGRCLCADRALEDRKSFLGPELRGTSHSWGPLGQIGRCGRKYVQVNTVCEQVATWREELYRLQSTWWSKWEIDTWYQALAPAEPQSCLTSFQETGEGASNPALAWSMDSQDKGGCALIFAESWQGNIPLAPELPLHAKHDALGLIQVRDNNNTNRGFLVLFLHTTTTYSYSFI